MLEVNSPLWVFYDIVEKTVDYCGLLFNLPCIQMELEIWRLYVVNLYFASECWKVTLILIYNFPLRMYLCKSDSSFQIVKDILEEVDLKKSLDAHPFNI